jgi:hypothetical protein
MSKENQEEEEQTRLRRCLRLNDYLVEISTLLNIRNDVNNLQVWNREVLNWRCGRHHDNNDEVDPYKEE